MQYSLMGFLLDCALAARSWSRHASASHIRRRQGEKYPLQHGTPSIEHALVLCSPDGLPSAASMRCCVVCVASRCVSFALFCRVGSGIGEGKGKGNEYLRSVYVSGFIRRGPNQQSAMQLQLCLDDGLFQGLLHASCNPPSTPASNVLMPAANEYLLRSSDDDEGIFRLCDHKN
jgi:hypothetical protein